MKTARACRVGVLASLLALGACQEEGAPPPQLSGFLSHHEQLEPGREDQAQLVYINPATNFARYQRVLVDPVVVWDAEGRMSAIPRPVLEQLASDLRDSMRRELAEEFEVAESAEPETLRLRLALIEVERSNAPSERVLIGTVHIEVEILDASSGERVLAAADSRGHPEPVDVAEAFDEWAGLLLARLAAFRAFDAVYPPE